METLNFYCRMQMSGSSNVLYISLVRTYNSSAFVSSGGARRGNIEAAIKLYCLSRAADVLRSLAVWAALFNIVAFN
jgi:hypothetical protein